MGFRRGKSGAGGRAGKRQVFDAENYSLVWSQTMAKDMRPQRVAIRSRLSIEILLYVAKTRQKGFGSIASLFQAIFSPLFSFALPSPPVQALRDIRRSNKKGP
jgi:hypothetical protein